MPDPVSRPDPASRLVELVAKIAERRAKVVVVGQGYVGLPVALRATEVGFPVVGYDVDPARVDALAAGRSYVEDVPDDRLAAVGVGQGGEGESEGRHGPFMRAGTTPCARERPVELRSSNEQEQVPLERRQPERRA